MDMVKHDYAEVNQVKLHYVFGGTKEAPAVILLHGFPQSWLTWRYIIPELIKTHRVIAVDLRGYGDSDKPQGQERYDKGTMAADIHALMLHLEIEKALLVGHDRGARVVRRFALDYPENVAGAVLLDILPTEYLYDNLSASDAAAKYWHWIFHLVPHLPERLIEGREEIYLDFILGRAPGLPGLLRSDGAWDDYVRIWKQPGAAEAALNDYRATYTVDLPRYREENAAGRRLTVPTLLLWGERGNLAGLPVLDIWKRVATNVSGFEIKDCGHYLPEEQPSQILQHLSAFSTASFKTD